MENRSVGRRKVIILEYSENCDDYGGGYDKIREITQIESRDGGAGCHPPL